MNQSKLPLEQRVKRSNLNLGIWTFLWLVSLALLSFGPQFLWQEDLSFTILTSLFYAFVSIKMLFANMRQIKSTDELDQQIFFNAAAITLGVVMIFGVGYEVLGRILGFTTMISHVYFVMGITFIVSVVAGKRHYK